MIRSLRHVPPERGASAVKALIVLAVLGALVYAGAYVVGWMQLANAETAFSKRLTEAGRPMPPDRVDAEDVRRQLIEIGRQEKLTLAPEDVTVELVPLDATNVERLAVFERAAIGIANKLPNHDINAMYLGMKVRVRGKWGPARLDSVVERNTWIHKEWVK
jgi:hypothetical protein